MARNPKVELRGHEGQVVHPITDGDCVIFPSGETLSHKLSEQEEVMYAPEVTNSSPMFKVGEGDSSDYSANVLDGAYQEAVLKGQTYVNTIQEPSADVITLPTPFTEYERTQSKTFTEMQDGTFGLNLVGQSYVNCIQEPSEPSYVALGENLEFQNKKVEYTTDGQIKSAMLNGMTLVNLATITKTKASGEITSAKALINLNFNKSMFVPNKSYTIKIELKINSNTNTKIYYELFGRTSDGISISTSNYIVADDNMVGTIYINDYRENILPLADAEKYSVDLYIAGRPIDTTLSCSYDIEVLSALFIEGDHTQEDIPYFEGMQSVTMTTKLENVCSRYNSSLAKGGKTFTVGTANDRRITLSDSSNMAKYGFKQNMKYLMQFKITNLNLDGEECIKLIFSDSNVSSGNALFGDYASTTVKITKNGIYRTVLTTSTVIDTSDFIIKGLAVQWEETTSTSRTLTISQIMCIEYQNGMENWDLPYFEDYQVMKPVKVRSVNKNEFNTRVIQSYYACTPTIHNDNSFTLVGANDDRQYKNLAFIIDVKPNTMYKLSYDVEYMSGEPNALYDIYTIDNKYYTHGNGEPFNSGNNTQLSIRFYACAGNGNIGTIRYYNVQLEESDTRTSFVPHQSKTISALEPITLRAIGNVKDTLDLSTGEYVQRIGEIVLDGSDDENWILYNNSTVNTISFRITLPNGKENVPSDSVKYLCDKFPVLPQTTALNNKETEWTFYNLDGNSIIIFSILRSKLTTEDLAGFKNYLSQNPIKIQYQLKNPITRKISLEYPNLQTYQDITHVQSIAMDGTLIPKIFLPSDISYKAMLKPNTSYNVIIDREVIDSTNQLTVNLGGTTANITANRTIVRTPSTLSNETLTFSGKDNRIAKAMLIEGSTLINGDLPHFDGIGDVKLGRVVENLCMANEILVGSATVTSTSYTDRIETKITKEGSCVEIFELTKQLQNGKKYFVYCPWNCSSSSHIFGAGFRMSYNGNISFAKQVKGVDNKKYIIFTIDEKEQLNPYTHFTIGFHGGMAVNTTMTIRRPILCEYIDGMENWDWESIGYFTGTRNIGNEFMRIGNKNLFDGIVELGGYTGTTGEPYNANDRVRSINKTYLKPGVYYLSSDNATAVAFGIFNIDGTFRQEQANTSSDRLKLVLEQEAYVHITVINPNLLNAKIQLEEASLATSYVAHKHNSLHILPDEQIPLTFEQGATIFSTTTSFAEQSNNTMTNRIRTGLLDLEPNETYRISCGDKNYIQATAFYNNSNIGAYTLGKDSKDCVFTTTKDVHKICINIAKSDMDANITPSALHQVRLEKVTDVTLRSIGNVKDELDLTRGVYIQRIGEVIVDGSENWVSEFKNSNVTSRFRLRVNDMLNEDIHTVNDNNLNASGVFPVLIDASDDREQIFSHHGSINIRINDSKLNAANDKDSFKAYLQSNPITVQYKLETPIEHRINIPMKNESNQTIAKPNGIFTLPLMYSGNNHIDINSQIYPKVQSRDYISYPVIANNNQLHTVSHNKLGTGNLTVNLCGTSITSVDGTSKCTITTPSTISQYELRLSGARNKVSNVCVFSGDYMNVNVPYVQGMMNAVNPTVKNIGKNLFDGEFEIGGLDWGTGMQIINSQQIRTVSFINIVPNKTYVLTKPNYIGGVFFYDKNKNHTETLWINNSETVTVTSPKNAFLLKIILNHNNIDTYMQLEESSTPSQYEPYKENTFKTSWSIGYNAMLKGKSITSANGTSINNALNRYRTDFIKIDFTKIYINSNNPYCLFLYDINKKYLGRFTDSWVTDREFEFNESNAYYFIVVFKTDDGEDTTTYISSKETRITLRSLPNGVRDELNLQTGEYIQRIEEVVLDGSSDEAMWFNDGWVNGDCVACYWNVNAMGPADKKPGTLNMICNTFPSQSPFFNAEGSVASETIWGETNTNVIYISIKKTKLTELSTVGFRQWMSQNPITVQYELKTPIIKQIDINNFPHSYKDGHVIIESNDASTNVTAQMTYQCVANRTGQIQEHTEQVEKQEHEINELEMLILENIRQQQNRE